MSIRVLSETIAAQIAAGEVVERPASVVKELLENSLDAGADFITIDIRQAGSKLIRVGDNGHGISSSEVELALHRHATSKLEHVDDLQRLHTLGFRGEALHSIASVSRLTLTSRHQDEEIGARINVEGGQVVDVRKIGVPPGTAIEVADLFYNVPARRKFLKSEATERRHIITAVNNYAMAYPEVRFQLTVDGREAFHTTGSGDLADVMVAVLGLETFREMVEVSPLPPSRPDLPPIEVFGFATVPHMHRSTRTQIVLFVNGRPINDQRLTYAVVQAYHTLLPSGRYPIAVLMVQMPAEDVDVNVHPTKAEVRFRSPDTVFSAVQRAVRRAVINQAGNTRFNDEQVDDWQPPDSAYPAPRSSSPFTDSAPASRHDQQSGNQLALEFDEQPVDIEDDEDSFYPHYNVPTPPHLREDTTAYSEQDDPTTIPEGIGKPQRPRTLPILRVVGQIGAAYIIAEGPAGMYLIDQYAAHQRILFEQLMAQYHAGQISTQRTLTDTVLDLSPSQTRLLKKYLGVLEGLGFEIEPFGSHTFRLRSIPAVLSSIEPSEVLHRLLRDLDEQPANVQADIEKLIPRLCQSAAIKAGQILEHGDMQKLLHQLERCQNPHTTPAGQATMIHMSTAQLEQQFGRT